MALFLCGYTWALYSAQTVLSEELPAAWEGKTIAVQGHIMDLPDRTSERQQFRFRVDRWEIDHGSALKPLPTQIRLSWYGSSLAVRSGESWRLHVRLKRPQGTLNPGGFDYEGWLFRQRIRATGYVVNEFDNQRLAQPPLSLGTLRQRLQQTSSELLDHNPFRGIFLALALGDRGDIDADQWRVLTATGTNHLMAISGLHVSLVAGLCFWLARGAWSRFGSLPLRYPAPRAGAWGALAGAVFYSAMAGFAVPTQRALIMITVAMATLIGPFNVGPFVGLAIALIGVLVWDPFAPLEPGFWLSFVAVACIFYVTARRQMRGAALHFGIQAALFIGLLPLTVLWFAQASVVAPLANLVAVPAMEFVVVPLVLIATLLSGIGTALASGIFQLATLVMDGVWWFLQTVSAWDWAVWRRGLPDYWLLASAAIGAALLLAPRGLPLRWLGAVWFVPLFALRPAGPEMGEARVTLLDVGQGLAVVVQTQQHALLYDSGPRYSAERTAGGSVIVPFMRSRGIVKLDAMVVGHGDRDHAGGTAEVLDQFHVGRLITNVDGIPFDRKQACEAGMNWTWDGVVFEVLHPNLARSPWRGNDSSCVLRVATNGKAIMIPGDIEESAERYLVSRSGELLRADMIIVPHHGSFTSSTDAFIDAVAPRWALFATGRGNRYGFPQPAVVNRYSTRGINVLNNAEEGAIDFVLGNRDSGLEPHGFRRCCRYYWHQPPPS